MSFSRSISSGLICQTCRMIRARAAPTTAPCHSSVRASWTSPACLQRSITSTARQWLDKHNSTTEDPEFAFLDDVNHESESVSHPAPTSSEPFESTSAPLRSNLTPDVPQSSPLPWYLQNRPMSVPQQAAIIPDLPTNPPPLLAPLLNYIANTAGLDDLLLLDLRHLDPPPALGPKLIMILCTARSEKHLHVSADRFCRHLRREYGLRANAAGLLGRNELKIKLRRKAKRMKMLANVGGTEPEGAIDDGIRTGWICCTVGKIEAHPEDTEMPGDNVKEFVGFRETKPGVNVVFQMFTEEKRAEIDLETLWGGVVKTAKRNDRTAKRNDRTAEDFLKELDDEESPELDEEEVDDSRIQASRREESTTPPASAPSHQYNKPRSTIGDAFPPSPDTNTFQQIRRMHTVGLRP